MRKLNVQPIFNPRVMTINPSIILRIGAGLCFIGHGAIAIGGSAKFVELLSTFGLDHAQAVMLLKGVGILDITVGLLILFKPSKNVLRWAMFWTGLTIVAWGIHGDSLMDIFRRVTYLTTPAALLALLYVKSSAVKDSELRTIPITSTHISGKGEEAIKALDLSMICMKLMDKHDGEGWTRSQCDEAAEEYKRYLKLNLLYPDANVVPNLAIDTIWHYHILDTQAYYSDCQTIFGHILHHYPYFGMPGQGDGKQFVNAFDRTKILYMNTFAVPMEGPNYLPSFQTAS
jgi:hypothetical protein